jgi:RHS repeat-associated protein
MQANTNAAASRAIGLLMGTEFCSGAGDPRLVGDPVDTLSGAMVDRMLDFRLIGPIELRWYRHYNSSQSHRRFGLGNGCAHEYERALRFEEHGIVYEEAVGSTVNFPYLVNDGDECALHGMRLRRICAHVFVIFRHAEPAMEFRFDTLPGRARLARLFSREHEVQFEYDQALQLVRIIDSTGRHISAVEDGNGRLERLSVESRATAPGYLLVAYHYDERGNLVATENAQGHGYAFAYDAANRMTRRRGRKGFQFYFSYDAQGRCVRAMGDGRLYGVALTYKIPGRVTEVRRPDRGIWNYSFTVSGALCEVVDPLGGVQKFFRDPSGRIALELDPNGNASTFVHDSAGAAIAKVDQLGRRSALPEDPNASNPRSHRVAGTAAEYEYGRLMPARRLSLPDIKRVERLNLPPRVQSLVFTQATGSSSSQQTYGVRPLGAMWWPPPNQGRIFSDAGKLVRQRDDFGRLRQWTYDASGNLAEYSDFDGSKWVYDYGAWHLLRRLTSPNGTDVRYAYTLAGEVSSFADGGGSVSEYRYNAKDHLIEVRRHGVVRETYQRDAVGNLIGKHASDGRELLRFEIGPGNLPTKRVLASGDEHSFKYDTHGRQLVAATGTDSVQFAYDELGNRTVDKRNGKGVEHCFSGWNVPTQTVFFDRFVVHYELRANGRLLITDPGGRKHEIRVRSHGLVERRFSNGCHEIAQYDGSGRCLFKSLQRINGQVWNRRYRWSGEGELRRIEDNLRGEVRHDYDAAHRLLRRYVGGRTEEYEFDAADNLIAQPQLTNLSLDQGNRLDTANGETFAYNDRNHIETRETAEGPVRYQYDSRDQLVRIETPLGVWEAEYDALGRRTRKHWNGATTEYYWNTDQLVAERNALGQIRLYVYADPLALAPMLILDYGSADSAPESCRRYFLFGDQLGTPQSIDDESGREVWRAQFAPFGEGAPVGNEKFECNLRFPGHYADTELGLHYNRFRYYSPTLARYIQSDPWGLGGGNNVYAYPANPLATADVRGLGDEHDEKCQKKEDEETAGTAKKGSDEMLTPEQLQAAADKIHGVLQDKKGKDFKLAVTTVTQGLDEHGNVVFTVTSVKGKLLPEQRDMAREVLGPDVRMPTGPRGRKNPGNVHHAEQRGIAESEGQTDRQQASSGGANHGGAACDKCNGAQQKADVQNVTGVQEKHGGTGRNIPAPWAQPPPTE